MKKLLIFSRRFYPDEYSGTETFIHNLYNRLQQYYSIRLVCGWYKSPDLLPPGTRCIRLSGLPRELGYWKLARFARKEIRAFEPDVILSNSIEIPRVKPFPTAVIFYDVNFGATKRSLMVKVKEWYYRMKCDRVNSIVAISEASSAQLQGLGIAKGKIKVVYSGIDLKSFKVTNPEAKSGPFILCYPSRIAPGKGQHVAIQALKCLPPEVRERCELWIAGKAQDPEYLNRLKRESAGLEVKFFTDVPDIVPYYQKADLIVFPTLLEEGFGYTAVEGMACGKPIAYSNDKAVLEATGGLGFPFERGDSSALAQIILNLFNQRTVLKDEGEKARKFVESRYSWEKTALQYRDILESISRK